MSIETQDKRRSMLKAAEIALENSEENLALYADTPDGLTKAQVYALQSIAASLLLMAKSESQR